MIKLLEDGTITSTPGFQAAGICAGIKASGNRDVALIYSEDPAVAAVTLTQNRFRAAPVDLCQEYLSEEFHRAIIINSGNANACTGEAGYQDAVEMSKLTAKGLKIDESQVFVASTGVIGQPMPMDKIRRGIAMIPAELSEDGGDLAAQAIMTTDLVPKEVAVEIEIEGEIVTIGGIAKGSGMIHPNMATMIAVITTDANISKEMLQKAFSASVNTSYNMVSVDGDTSTNDSAFILANSRAKHPRIETNDENYLRFKRALDLVNQTLAKKIARDGEGATKLVEVEVKHATSVLDAQKVAKSVVTSSLVKTAMFGQDGNWGRIISAIGNSEADFEPSKLKIFIKSEYGEVQIVEAGSGIAFDVELLDAILTAEEINIRVDLCNGGSHGTAWGCDLSYDYVKINADYRT